MYTTNCSRQDHVCSRKQCLPSRKAARRVVKRRLGQDGRGKARLSVYQCEYCGGWHVGRPR